MDSSGNLWIYGGLGYADISASQAAGFLADLWMLNTQTLQWAWMGGNTGVNAGGVYGAQGVSDGTSCPHSLSNAASWQDASGNFWLYGGQAASGGVLDDFWKYSPATGQWTWISGDKGITPLLAPVFGTPGVENAQNRPAGLYGGGSFTDADGNFWIFTGFGVSGSGGANVRLNVIWKYNPSTGKWTFMGGSTGSTAVAATYGVQGTASASNDPGGRQLSAFWTSLDGNVWLFDGFTYVGEGGSLFQRRAASPIASSKQSWARTARAITKGRPFLTKDEFDLLQRELGAK